MIIAVEDKSYRCKDCDSFNQCAYYHCRRPTSHICKEFTNDSKVAEILDKISAEIERLDTESWELSVTDVLNVISRYREGVIE